MAEQLERAAAQGKGVGSRAMVSTLLETLTIRGRLSDRERAIRASGLDHNELIDASQPLESDVLARMLAAASVEISVARALGHRLISPESLGMPLYALGLATPEKAYRRVQALLPRESSGAIWTTDEIQGESARLSYRPDRSTNAASHRASSLPSCSSSCAIRRGMLEAIPTLYGLLPATVTDVKCVARGHSECEYRVEWKRSTRRGVMLGSWVGAALGLTLTALIVAFGSGGLMTAIGVMSGILVFGSAALLGRSLDLAAQLNAVGGTRRGQLALFEQVDDQLATKLDALARADAKLGETPTSFRVGLSPSRSGDDDESDDASSHAFGDSEKGRGILLAAQTIHSVAGDLECWFEAQSRKTLDSDVPDDELMDERGRVREIRDWAVRISDEIGKDHSTRRSLDLSALVARGIASVRPLLPDHAIVRLEVEEPLEPVSCEPVQIEQVVIQLVKNAIEASEAVMETPEATVSLRQVRSGIEISVEDEGAGIESSAVDEVFDPFFGEAPLGTHGGLGLPLCLRIVEAHGGELRIEVGNRKGTRVSVFLPQEHAVGEASSGVA